MEHGFCIEPDQCLCNVGWSGSNCTECVTQQNCPGACSTPAGCVCQDPHPNDKGICMIKNSPPNFTKYNSTATVDDICLFYNKKLVESSTEQVPNVLHYEDAHKGII